MKFEFAVARALMGNDISVHIEADDGKPFDRVQVVLDSFSLADDNIEPSDTYEQLFSQAGDARSGLRHHLTATAFLPDGTSHSGTKFWTDQS